MNTTSTITATAGKYNIVYFVYKATSELDFGVPLLWKIKEENPELRIAVVYCVINKSSILRGSTFYSEFFKSHGIDEFDLGDFVVRPLKPFTGGLRALNRASAWDTLHLDGYREKKLTRGRLLRASKRLVNQALYRLISFDRLFSHLKPDLIFFALRGYTFQRKDEFLEHTYGLGARVILFPHGAFCSTGKEPVFYSDHERDPGKPLPEFCDYWYSCKEEETVDLYPHMRNQMFHVGYPGLDSEWLSFLKRRYSGRKQEAGSGELRCLFIIRKFMRDTNDYGVLQFDEFMEMLKTVISGIKRAKARIRLVIKPHPSNDYEGLSKILDATGFDNWEISRESNYLETTRSDFVISVPSTSVLVPLMYGLPVILLNCSVKEQFDGWWFMRELFSGFRHFVERLDQFEGHLNDVLDQIEGAPRGAVNKRQGEEIDYFRKYYPDNSLGLCKEKINERALSLCNS